MTEYPKVICGPCGRKYGKPRAGASTFHDNTCGWCGEMRSVTEPRDFGYPPFNGRAVKQPSIFDLESLGSVTESP